jgi:hypothetical protein
MERGFDARCLTVARKNRGFDVRWLTVAREDDWEELNPTTSLALPFHQIHFSLTPCDVCAMDEQPPAGAHCRVQEK